jgi:hypothetical protein
LSADSTAIGIFRPTDNAGAEDVQVVRGIAPVVAKHRKRAGDTPHRSVSLPASATFGTIGGAGLEPARPFWEGGKMLDSTKEDLEDLLKKVDEIGWAPAS